MNLTPYYTAVFYCMAGLLGLCVGSFLNVVIYRVPLHMSVASPPSHCPNCGYQLKWYDNIPVISYLSLGGKCRSCREPISFRYTAVEIGNALLWLLSVRCFFEQGLFWILTAAATCSLLLCVFFIDLEHMVIPDRFQVMLGLLGVAVSVADTLTDSGAWLSHLLGGAAGFAIPFGIAWLSEKLTGREGFGGGDIKFCGVMGLFLGWPKLILAILLSSVTGSVILLFLQKKSGEKHREFPFAPFLTGGFAVALFFGDRILSAYLSLIL